MPNQTHNQGGSRSKRAEPPIRDARDAAYRHLSAYAMRYPDLLPKDIRTGDLDVRDASLAHMIVEQSVRRWRTIEFVLEQVSNHKSHELEPRMRAVLLGGAAQLLLLDRVPPHAVLDESVSWAKQYIRPGAGGMVNAILRKVARARGETFDTPWEHHLDSIPLGEGGMLKLNGIELPEHGRRRLGIACSLPDALLARWEELYEDPTPSAMHTLCNAPTILNVTHHSGDLPDIDGLTSHDAKGHCVFGGGRASLISLLEEHLDMWVQDPASSSTLASNVNDPSPEVIIDLCAGQGTKTRQLRAIYPDASIIACDIEPQRLGTLRATFQEDEGTEVRHVSELGADFAHCADLVLADVPCTNTGVLARRLEARYRPIDKQVQRLVQTQREILSHARELLKASGTLIYATCSLEVDENENNTKWACEELGFELMQLQRIEPAGQPGGELSGYQDASFAAMLRLIRTDS